MIQGVIISPLTQIFDERGKVMHMLREDDIVFSKFGEIYFSYTYPNAIKAWHLHTKMTINYAVVSGAINFVLYDDREDSPTKGEIQEIFMSPENYYLVTVPPLIWNGFKGLGVGSSIVANCATMPHDPDEIRRKPAFDNNIPYNWDLH